MQNCLTDEPEQATVQPSLKPLRNDALRSHAVVRERPLTHRRPCHPDADGGVSPICHPEQERRISPLCHPEVRRGVSPGLLRCEIPPRAPLGRNDAVNGVSSPLHRCKLSRKRQIRLLLRIIRYEYIHNLPQSLLVRALMVRRVTISSAHTAILIVIIRSFPGKSATLLCPKQERVGGGGHSPSRSTRRDTRIGTRSDSRSSTGCDSRIGTGSDSHSSTRSDSRIGTGCDSRSSTRSDSRIGTGSDSRSSTRSDSRIGTGCDSRIGTRCDSRTDTHPVKNLAFGASASAT